MEVPSTWNCTLRPEWQCRPHCHSTSSVRAARPHTATRRRAYRNGALRAEWQCRRVGGRGARRGRLRAQGHARARRRAGQGVCRLLGRRARGAQARPAARNMLGPSPAASPERCRRRCGPQAAPASRGPSRGLPTTRVPRAQGVRRETRGARARQTRVAEARGEPGGATARGARGTCARQEPPRVRPGPTRRPRRCERCAEIDEYVAQK